MCVHVLDSESDGDADAPAPPHDFELAQLPSGSSDDSVAVGDDDYAEHDSHLVASAESANPSCVDAKQGHTASSLCRGPSRAAGVHDPRGEITSQWNLSTVWAGNIAVVRREDQGVGCLVCSNMFQKHDVK